MRLSLVFLCLSLAALSLASTFSAKKKGTLSSSKKVKRSGIALCATDQSFQAAKKPVQYRKAVLKWRPKNGIGAAKDAKKSSPTAGKDNQGDSLVQSKGSEPVLNFFPKVLVELIGEYLEGFSVVFERDWSAVYSPDYVAVDSERHYLITYQYIQALSHGDGEPVSIGNPDLSDYDDFQSSHDGRSLFFTGKTQEQVSKSSSEKTTRWLVQETGTGSLKSVTLESGESYFAGNKFVLSANGKTLLSRLFNWASRTWTTSVYQIEEHEKAGLASKKADFDGYAVAVSRNGNRILMEYAKKKQLEVHDISGDRSNLVLEINCTRACAWPYALNNDGSKAAFIDNYHKLYIVDVDKERGSISLDQLSASNIPGSVIGSRLRYDAKGRLYAFGSGNLWLVDPSKSEFISLEKAQPPRRYMIQDSAVSPNIDYIALLFRSKKDDDKGEYQYQMIVKRNEEVTKIAFLRLCGYKS